MKSMDKLDEIRRQMPNLRHSYGGKTENWTKARKVSLPRTEILSIKTKLYRF